jgi:hypothetical protein
LPCNQRARAASDGPKNPDGNWSLGGFLERPGEVAASLPTGLQLADYFRSSRTALLQDHLPVEQLTPNSPFAAQSTNALDGHTRATIEETFADFASLPFTQLYGTRSGNCMTGDRLSGALRAKIRFVSSDPTDYRFSLHFEWPSLRDLETLGKQFAPTTSPAAAEHPFREYALVYESSRRRAAIESLHQSCLQHALMIRPELRIPLERNNGHNWFFVQMIQYYARPEAMPEAALAQAVEATGRPKLDAIAKRRQAGAGGPWHTDGISKRLNLQTMYVSHVPEDLEGGATFVRRRNRNQPIVARIQVPAGHFGFWYPGTKADAYEHVAEHFSTEGHRNIVVLAAYKNASNSAAYRSEMGPQHIGNIERRPSNLPRSRKTTGNSSRF